MATSTSSHSSPPLYDLQLPFPVETPSEQLAHLSNVAKSRGINQADKYGKDAPWLDEWQDQVATTLGKERGLFIVSGVMAQSIALSIYATPSRPSFICHPTSHLLLHEEGGYDALLGYTAIPVGDRKRPLSYQDVVEGLKRYEEGGKGQATMPSPPCCIIIETPQRESGGHCVAWEDLVRIREFANHKGIKMHLDGARLWESQPFYHPHTLSDICSLFDSVYVSFYKGLGAMTGAMLLGPKDFITQAARWNRRFGGNLFTVLPFALSSCERYNTYIGTPTFHDRRTKLRHILSLLHQALPQHFQQGHIRFEPPTPDVCMVHVYLKGNKEQIEAARDRVLATENIRLFRLLRGVYPEDQECYFEWTLGPQNLVIPDEAFVRGWTAFLNHLK